MQVGVSMQEASIVVKLLCVIVARASARCSMISAREPSVDVNLVRAFEVESRLHSTMHRVRRKGRSVNRRSRASNRSDFFVDFTSGAHVPRKSRRWIKSAFTQCVLRSVGDVGFCLALRNQQHTEFTGLFRSLGVLMERAENAT